MKKFMSSFSNFIKENLAAGLCIIASVSLIAIGLANNQQLDVFQKAIKICLECIGIG